MRSELEKKHIETRTLFGSIPTQQPAFSHLKKKYKGKLPNADYLGLNAFYVGCHRLPLILFFYCTHGETSYQISR